MLIRIVEFPGSCCLDSPRRELLDHGVARALEAGAEVRSVYIRDAGLAILLDGCEIEFDVGLCEGESPDGIESHHLLLIATPQSNGEGDGLVENAFNWMRGASVSANLWLRRLIRKSMLSRGRSVVAVNTFPGSTPRS